MSKEEEEEEEAKRDEKNVEKKVNGTLSRYNRGPEHVVITHLGRKKKTEGRRRRGRGGEKRLGRGR